LYDYHPKAIPALQSQQVDSDEVLYYVGDFIEIILNKHITLHPKGILTALHLEQWKAALVTQPEELAVMVDTLEPLWCRRSQMGIDDGEYYKSW
jgi:homogentisate 1,2-dioxygenase